MFIVFFCFCSIGATPKQIREVMNVDGLTNDEVKSHLQVPNSFVVNFNLSICFDFVISII